MKTLKKNQIVLFVIGLMIIAAGYLSYTNNENNNLMEAGMIVDSEEMAGIGDAKLVSANVAELNTIESNTIQSNTINDIAIESNTTTNNVVNEVINEEIDSNQINEANAIETNSISVDEYFTTSKLERDAMYSQRIENYQDILNNGNISEAQKKTAQAEITSLNSEQNAIMIAENLIKTKGIEDLIIFINGESINIIVKGDDLDKEEIAQIQNIVTRELEADIVNIHIMNKAD